MVLADACALVAFFAGDGLSATGVNAMQGDVAVSSITVWELTRKASLGKLPPLPTANGSFAGWLVSQGFHPRPLSWLEAERANRLPDIHKDPMDRMLIAQALSAGCSIITEDRMFNDYGITTIW